MIREYVNFIGLFSKSKYGLEMLGEFKIFHILMEYIDKAGKFDYILIPLLYVLDFSHDGQCRLLLQNSLENGSEQLMLAGIDLLRLLYRTELKDFVHWAIDLLVTKMCNGS